MYRPRRHAIGGAPQVPGGWSGGGGRAPLVLPASVPLPGEAGRRSPRVPDSADAPPACPPERAEGDGPPRRELRDQFPVVGGGLGDQGRPADSWMGGGPGRGSRVWPRRWVMPPTLHLLPNCDASTRMGRSFPEV